MHEERDRPLPTTTNGAPVSTGSPVRPREDTPNANGLPPLQVSRTDDPRVVAEAATEDYSLHIVPGSWRMERGRLQMAWWGLVTALFYMYIAALVALTVGTRDAIIGIVLTIVAFSAVNHVLSRAAAKNGLTVALFSRTMFGFAGAAIASLLFAATAIYYFVFEGSVVAVAAKGFFDGQGASMAIEVWYLVVVLITLPLVMRGVRAWMDRINAVLLPVYAIGLIAVVVWVTSDAGGYSGAWASLPGVPGGVGGPGWIFAFSVYMGVWVLMMYTMDYGRLAREEDGAYHSKVTFGPAFYVLTFGLNGIIGIYLVQQLGITNLGEGELATAMVGVTGLVGLLFIAVTQARINTANLYLASTNLQSFVSRVTGFSLPRTVWVFAAGLIAYLIMLTNVFSFILDALSYQGIAIVAWVAIALVQIAYLRRIGRAADAEFRPGRVPAFNPAGLIAWAVATVVGVLLKTETTTFFGVWGLPVVFVLAAASYAALLTVAPVRWSVLERPNDPMLEVEDPWEDRVRCHACERSYLAREMDRDPSHGHEAICSACATGVAFTAAAVREARV